MHDTGRSPSPERILVTGATGFIGGKLVRALVERGHEVRTLVRDASRAPEPDRTTPFVGDLLDASTLAGVEEGIDVAIHCASILGKWGTPDADQHDVNVRGALNVLERFEGAPIRRYVHLSAGGVTGPLPDGPVDETYECRPATAYERTKLEGERRVLERSSEIGVPALVLRPTFTYGPGDPHKVALFRAVKKGRYVFIGGGHSVNHPVFVDDLIAGIFLGVEKGVTGQTYIIGGERPVSKRELVNTIADALGVRRPRLSIPRWVASCAAPVVETLGKLAGIEPILTRSRVMMMADDFGYTIAKARRELGYEPRTGLREGIERTVEAYRRAGVL